MPIPILARLRSAFGGPLLGATEIDLTDTEQMTELLSAILVQLRTDVNALVNAGTNTPLSSSFVTFQDSLTINAATIVLYNGISAIYTSLTDKSTFINLPTDAQIASASIPYPVVFEFTHLGGQSRGNDNLLLVNVIEGEDGIATPSNAVQRFTTLRFGDVSVFEKTSATANWTEVRSAAQEGLPSGLFTLRGDFVIDDITAIATQLADATISQGDAFLVEKGGNYFGTTIGDQDVIVAANNNPSLLTTSTDWLVVRQTANASVTPDNTLLLSSFTRSGIRFDGNRNVFVNESNVIMDTNTSGDQGSTAFIAITPSFDGSTNQTLDLVTSPFQWSDLIGGRLALDVEFGAIQTSGSLPQLVSIVFRYQDASGTGTTFTFPLTNLSASFGRRTVSINIPNANYVGILNRSVSSVVLNVRFSGQSFSGQVTFHRFVNTRTGTLHDPIFEIAATAAANAVAPVRAQVNTLLSGAGVDASTLADLERRSSPLRSVQSFVTDPGDAFFQSTTASASFPSSLTGLTRVDPDHNIFTTTSALLFVAVRSSVSHVFRNITQDQQFPLTAAEGQTNASLDLGASFLVNGESYFVFLVSNLGIGNEVTVLETSSSQVVAWQNDIDNLNADVEQIRQALRVDPILNLPRETISWLTNDFVITQQETTTLVPSPLNAGFDPNGLQAFFAQTGPVPARAGAEQNTAAVNAAPAARRGRKLVYLPLTNQADGQTLIQGQFVTNSGTVNLVVRDGTNVAIRRFLPAVPQTTRTVTRRPVPANTVATDWFLIPLGSGSTREPLDDQLTFVSNLPNTSSTVTLHYRYVSNGQAGPELTLDLLNAGGPNDTVANATISLPNGQTITMVWLWSVSRRVLEVQLSPNADAGTRFIFDVEVRPEWTETITTPARSASSELIPAVTFGGSGSIPVFFSPSLPTRTNMDASTMLVAIDDTLIDTGYALSQLFGGTDNGHLNIDAGVDDAPVEVYDWEGTLNTDLSQQIFSARALPYGGLFTEDHGSLTLARTDTQLEAVDAAGNPVNLASGLILESPTSLRFELQVDDAGNLSTTEIKT